MNSEDEPTGSNGDPSETESVPTERQTETLIPEEIVGSLIESRIPISIRKQDRIDYLAVDVIDWERLEKYISNLQTRAPLYQNAFWASVGFLLNAVFALIGLYSTGTPPETLMIVAWCLLAVSTASSLIFGLVSYLERPKLQASIELIKSEMEIIKRKNTGSV